MWRNILFSLGVRKRFLTELLSNKYSLEKETFADSSFFDLLRELWRV